MPCSIVIAIHRIYIYINISCVQFHKKKLFSSTFLLEFGAATLFRYFNTLHVYKNPKFSLMNALVYVDIVLVILLSIIE